MFVSKRTHNEVIAAYREGIEHLQQQRYELQMQVSQLQTLTEVQAAEIEILQAKVPQRGERGRFKSRFEGAAS